VTAKSHKIPELRKLRTADFFRLYEIDQICFEPEIAYSRAELFFHLKHPESLTRVVELEGAVVAFAVARFLDDLAAHIITLDVVPELRRRGIGSSLLGAIHREFRSRNLAVSILEVDTENEAALKFYRKFCYETVETIRGYYSGRRDAYRMVMYLD
jgi:ribosomal-protein-alanine N-acetyltransferase